jgi:hypothetical protein
MNPCLHLDVSLEGCRQFLDRRGEFRSLVTRLETDDDEFGHLWDLVVHLDCQSSGTKSTAGKRPGHCRAWN